jgi:hypothetical protein
MAKSNRYNGDKLTSSDDEELARGKLMETRLSSGCGTGTKTNDPGARAVDKVRLAVGD